jgi:hypothetical protein
MRRLKWMETQERSVLASEMHHKHEWLITTLEEDVVDLLKSVLRVHFASSGTSDVQEEEEGSSDLSCTCRQPTNLRTERFRRILRTVKFSVKFEKMNECGMA